MSSRRLIRGVVASLVVAMTGSAATGLASARNELVLNPHGLRGWRAVAVSVSAARSDLGSALRGQLSRTLIQATGASTRGERLRSDAFVFARASAAVRVLGSWTHLAHAKRVSVGQSGRLSLTRHKHQVTATVVWRDGRRLGVLKLRGGRNASRAALDLARLADAALRTRLPADKWGKVAEQISADGAVSKRTALEAFAVAYGGLPGVRTPVGRSIKIPDGTAAVAWLLRYWSQITSRQRGAAKRALGVEFGGKRTARLASYGDRNFTEASGIEHVAAGYAATYAQLTGHPLSLGIVAGFTTSKVRAKNGVDALADSVPLKPFLGPDVCRIRIMPAGKELDPALFDVTIAHEVFHCFQFDINPKWKNLGDWIMEGTAEWASLAIDPAKDGDLGWLSTYIGTPHQPVATRTYDAVGYWGHAADMIGTDALFARMTKILTATNVESAVDAAGGFAAQFLTTWGPSVFRQPAFTPDWRMTSPIAPPDFFALAPGGLDTIEGHGDVSAAPYTTSQYIVNTHADIVHMAIKGFGEIYSNGLEYSDLSDAWFCTSENCTCPPDTEGSLPPLHPLFDRTWMGIAGGPEPTSGGIESYSLKDFCHPKPKPPPPGGGGGGGGGPGGGGGGGGTSGGGLGCTSSCGSSNGDPHLQTIDGYDYDFQAAGEFTAVKSTTDDLEIQERQEPFGSLNATVNTAVAMQVAGTRVEVDRGSSPIVRVNGAVTTLGSSTRTLPGGGTVAGVSGNIVVTWPDGTQAQLWGVGPWGVAYLVQPAAARAGHLAGLLGAFNGDPGHLTGRDGRVYAVSTLEGKRGFDLKYHHFGESWRISQAQSLFTYPRGKSTASYTDRRVPRKILSLSSLPTRQRSQAERTCRGRGIKRKLILHDCVYDVVVTKHKAFASSGARLQRTASTHHKTTPPPPPPPPPGGGTEQFTTTCYSDDTIVPAGQVQNVPPGTFAGIEADLNPRVGMAVTVAHWTAPDGGIDELNPTGGTNYNEFAEMDIPGQYSVYVTYAGDGTHSAARSATCMWNVTG